MLVQARPPTTSYDGSMRIVATETAAETVRMVRAAGRDDMVMVLSNGCCEATAPYLYDHYLPDPDTVLVGEIEQVRVLAPVWLARMYPEDELLVDVEQDVIDDSFSLETEHDRRFVLRTSGRAAGSRGSSLDRCD